MLIFLYYFFFIFFFSEIIETDNLLIIKNYYIIIFFIFFIFNIVFVNKEEINDNEKFNIDLRYKHFFLFFKNPSFFFNYYINNFKKFFLYIFGFKYRTFFLFIKFFLLKYKHFFLFWRPLFKKSSYFGYYRSNRSKWIK